MATRNLSHMQKENKKKKAIDPCPVCGDDLHLDDEYTNRVGLLNERDDIIGWLCPYCRTEFDLEDHMSKVLGENHMRGEA